MRVLVTYCFLLSFLFVPAINSLGQNYSSIKKYRSRSESDEIREKLTQARGLYKDNPDLALSLVEEAIFYSINLSDNKLTAESYTLFADINFHVGEANIAHTNYKKAYNILSGSNENLAFYQLLPKIGLSAENNNELDEALKYYQEFLELAQLQSNDNDQLDATNAIARVYQKKGEIQKSEEHFNQVLIQGNSTSNTNKRAVLYSNKSLGKIKETQNQDDEALQYYLNSNTIAYELNDAKEVNESYDNMTQVYRNNSDWDNGLATQQKALEYNQQNYDDQSTAKNRLEIANIYIDKKEEPKAIEQLEIIGADSNNNIDLETKSKSLKVLSKAYRKTGRPDKATELQNAYEILQDSLRALDSSQVADRSFRTQQIENIQNKLLLLEKDKELDLKTIQLLQNEQKLQQERIQRQVLINYALGLLLILIVIGAYIIYRNIRQKRIANQLLTLKSLRSQMNPHFIFNALNSVNNFISKSDERAANKYLSDFSRLMRQVMQFSQEDFIPLSSEIEILELYVKLEHHRFQNKFDYTFHVDDDIIQDDFLIPPMLLQPYIENAVWHGLRYKEKKGYLKIAIEQAEGSDNLVITIEDNGIGRTKSQEIKTKNQKTQKSTGIKNINSRLKILNDVYGTKLKVSITDLNPEDRSGTNVLVEIESARSLNLNQQKS